MCWRVSLRIAGVDQWYLQFSVKHTILIQFMYLTAFNSSMFQLKATVVQVAVLPSVSTARIGCKSRRNSETMRCQLRATDIIDYLKKCTLYRYISDSVWYIVQYLIVYVILCYPIYDCVCYDTLSNIWLCMIHCPIYDCVWYIVQYMIVYDTLSIVQYMIVYDTLSNIWLCMIHCPISDCVCYDTLSNIWLCKLRYIVQYLSVLAKLCLL